LMIYDLYRSFILESIFVVVVVVVTVVLPLK